MLKKLLLFFILLISLEAQADKIAKLEKKDNKNMADKAHLLISKKILNYSERIDQFFSDQRSNDVVNSSQLRFSTVFVKEEAIPVQSSVDLQFNLVLPRTQKKLQLFVEGQGNEAGQDQPNSGRNNTPGQDTSERVANATTAGLRYVVDTAGIETSSDAGIRVNLPPQLFGRLRFKKEVKLNIDWIFRPREEIVWVDREGFSSTTNLDFDNKVNLDLLLRMVNRVDWSEKNDNIITLTNGPSLFHTIDKSKGFSYHAHVTSLNNPSLNVNKYAAAISYRQLLYKNWFYWELGPSVSFHRDNNFHRKPAFTVEFEVVLGDI